MKMQFACVASLVFVASFLLVLAPTVAVAQVRITKSGSPNQARGQTGQPRGQKETGRHYFHGQRNQSRSRANGYRTSRIFPIYAPAAGYSCRPDFVRATPYGYYSFTTPVFQTAIPFQAFHPPFNPVLPPVAAPAGVGFPLAAEDFAGENFARKDAVAAERIAPAAAALDGESGFDGLNEIRRRVSVLKSSTPQSRQRADRLISMGDIAFADQKLARANALYRDAIAKAPDYAASHFRLAHAYIATRQYTLAQKSLMVALELSGSVKRDGFSLEDMYQGDQFIRDKHFDTLMDASNREPNDGGLLLLLGLFMHYDNKPLQAREHFTAANKIPGLHRNYTRYFLPAKQIAEL